MKSIIVVGDYISQIHEESIFLELCKRDFKVFKIKHSNLTLYLKFFKWIPFMKEFSKKLMIFINEFNVISKIKLNHPSYIFFYRPLLFSSNFFLKIKKLDNNIKIICYNNDNPFSKKYSASYWKNYKSNCKYADLILAYRDSDIKEYRKISNKQVKIFPPYVTDLVVNCSERKIKNFSASNKITFVGHFEDDGRLETLDYLYKNNLKIKLFGPKSGWNTNIIKKNIGLQFLPVMKMNYQEYVEYLSNLLIGLCFLSKLNKDVLTRRCFEFTYMGVCLVSEYNSYLADLFLEDNEAIYFRNKEELLEKLNYLLKNREYLKKIALAGQQKCHKLRVTVKDRIDSLENYILKK